MTVAWHCTPHEPAGPGAAVNFYTGTHQDRWRDWGIRGSLVWPTSSWRT